MSAGAQGWFLDARPAEQAAAGGFGIERLYRAFLAARAALGLALVSAQLVSRWLVSAQNPPTLGLSAAYALLAGLAWLLPLFRPPLRPPSLARVSSPQWWSSIGLDLLLFGALNALDTSGVNYGALFVMPVLMAGVLSPRRMAVATAAGATLALLLVAGWSILRGAEVGLRMTQAGLVGAGLFVVALLASELAARLAREARAARGSLALARQQEELNRLVIDEMQEGVLVLDRRGRVRAANPAAHQLLGDPENLLHLHQVTALAPLVEAVDRAYGSGAGPDADSDVVLTPALGTTRSLRLKLRFTRRREQEGGEELCVLFLEDNRALLARSRQEKLAAMGRVSAGIAHEIRNPLAAIAQANALLAEDLSGTRNEQLTQMVSSNVQRLKRLVDDVMEVAPGVDVPSQPLDAAQLVRDVVEDWVRINGLSQSERFVLLPLAGGGSGNSGSAVVFEPEHLRRVLVNLLDNALRHAGTGPGAISVRIDALDEGLELVVHSDAAPIPPEVERHLFEPFFSTRSRGSGLGLYICRELCERHGARIEYRRRREAPEGNEFCVLMRRFES